MQTGYDDPQEFLNRMLETYLRGNPAELASFGTPEALAALLNDDASTYSGFELYFDDTCLVGSSGAGGCLFTLIPQDSTMNPTPYQASYSFNIQGVLEIDTIDFNGDFG